MKKREPKCFVVHFKANVSNAPWGRNEDGDRSRKFEPDAHDTELQTSVCAYEFNQRDAIKKARTKIAALGLDWIGTQFVRWSLTGVSDVTQ